MTTFMASTHGSSTQHNQVDKVMEEHQDIFTSPTRVPLHYQVKHSIELTLVMSLLNGPLYRHSLLENEEMKHRIQELLQKGHIRPISSPYASLIVLVQKKDET
jgi:hypothetical protein